MTQLPSVFDINALLLGYEGELARLKEKELKIRKNVRALRHILKNEGINQGVENMELPGTDAP